MPIDVDAYRESHQYQIQRQAESGDWAPVSVSINWQVGLFRCPKCEQVISHEDVKKKCPGKEAGNARQ